MPEKNVHNPRPAVCCAAMWPVVDTRDPVAVEREVQTVYLDMFPEGSPEFVGQAFQWVRAAFEGRHKDYLSIDAVYHDLEHTLQGTLCMARLLHARAEAKGRPPISGRMFELGLLAILMHDTGYLKKREDTGGTGAKYTLTHVARSVRFAEEFMGEMGFAIGEIRSVQNMIRCTGVHVDLNRIPFQSEVEKIVGHALGTADLLGQMSATDYIDKLGILYAEFEESARFYEGKMVGTLDFASAQDLIQRTPDFWTGFVLPKLDRDFWGLYRFLNKPYPNGPNEYLLRIEDNMQRLRDRLEGRDRQAD
jgi:hypothetical protein